MCKSKGALDICAVFILPVKCIDKRQTYADNVITRKLCCAQTKFIAFLFELSSVHILHSRSGSLDKIIHSRAVLAVARCQAVMKILIRIILIYRIIDKAVAHTAAYSIDKADISRYLFLINGA